MVDVLVVPDGAAQPVRPGLPTAFEAASTPVLDRLAEAGLVVRVATTPAGSVPGSETGIAGLLGVPACGRGWVDAAGYDVRVPAGLRPWRADLVYNSGRRASIRQARDACAHLGPGAHAVGGHRLVLLAASRPADRRLLGLHVRVWPDGMAPGGVGVATPTTLVCAPGAAAGYGRLCGARVVVAAGATGDTDTDLCAKAAAARAAVDRGAARVVVHVGGPDEAAHRRDGRAVVAMLERLDAELLGPLRDLVGAVGGRLAVCPDHGTDPQTGLHDGAPVPAVVWGCGVGRAGPSRLSERAPGALISAGGLLG